MTAVEDLMNRAQLIDAVAAATGLPRAQVEATLSATLTQVRGAVASGDKVQLPGFGTFERRERGARTARNPSTGAPLQLAATRTVGLQGRCHVQAGGRRQRHHHDGKESGGQKDPGQGHHVEDHSSEEGREEVAAHARVTRLCVADRSLGPRGDRNT